MENFFLNDMDISQMTKIDIEYFTIKKALTNIGGFSSLCLMFYGLFTSFILPKIFMNDLSKYMNENKSKIG